MPRGFTRDEKDGPSLDGSVLVGFMLVVAASFGAFVWVDDVQNRYSGEPVRVYQQESEAGEDDTAAGDGDQPIDDVTTSSVVAAADTASSAPQCNIDACDDAYRSFRVSDCTFQPYEGPRRLCTR